MKTMIHRSVLGAPRSLFSVRHSGTGVSQSLLTAPSSALSVLARGS